MNVKGESLKKTKVCLGIDYGTTKTVVSFCTRDDAFPQLLLLDNNGSSNVPTCVYLPSADAVPLIGVQAENRGMNDNLHFASDIKMLLTSDRSLLSVDDREYSAADLTELYLKEIRKCCESYYQIEHVVITRPAQGDPTRDDRLMKAVRNAGFQDVEFIAEPEAAAYAYLKQNPSQFRNALVVDWGGGTLDMTLVSVEGRDIRAYPEFTRGWSENLGGVDIDYMLFEYVGKLMTQQDMGDEWNEDVLNSAWILNVMNDMKTAKIALSDPTQSIISLSLSRSSGEPYPVLKLKRSAYIELIKKDILESAAEKAAGLIREIKAAGIEPEIILLFGGTSLIPEVAEYMYQETGLKCTPWSSAKEAVSLGAALKAREKWAFALSSSRRTWWIWLVIILSGIVCVSMIPCVFSYIDDVRKIDRYRKAAEEGNAEAQLNLGICYELGHGTPLDHTEAVKWYRKAAEGGNAEAQLNLAICYEYGRGVRKDELEAYIWYSEAAAQGNASAKEILKKHLIPNWITIRKIMLTNRINEKQYQLLKLQAEKDIFEEWKEHKYYQRGAEQGVDETQLNLSICNENGQGVPQDHVETFWLYSRAAEYGIAEAQFELGNKYYHGQGVKKDEKAAVEWYRKAAAQGNKDAKTALKRLGVE